MKVIKSINNNVSRCLDSKGREVVVFGKGIGFYKNGEDIPLSKINRTFYNIKDQDYGVLSAIPTVLINTAIYIMDYAADELSVVFTSASALTLADHLQFAIERKDKNIYLELPLLQDIAQLYPDELRVAQDALIIIERMTGEKLPRMEAGTIAMHFITDRLNEKNTAQVRDTTYILDKCTEIIEDEFSISVQKDTFNYSRFVTHLDYLLRRLDDQKQISSENQAMFEEIKNNYPDSYECALRIRSYLNEEMGRYISNEEILYLVIHINRLLSRM